LSARFHFAFNRVISYQTATNRRNYNKNMQKMDSIFKIYICICIRLLECLLEPPIPRQRRTQAESTPLTQTDQYAGGICKIIVSIIIEPD